MILKHPLSVKIVDGKLTIQIGIHALAYACAFSEWANVWNGEDYVRTFAITDPNQFAEDVANAMRRENEDGSSPLTYFIDQIAQGALDDGSTGAEYEQSIQISEFSPAESWAKS